MSDNKDLGSLPPTRGEGQGRAEGAYALRIGWTVGRANLIHIRSETPKTVQAVDEDRLSHSSWGKHPRRVNKDEIIARFKTLEAAREALAAADTVWKSHTDAVTSAANALSRAKNARTDAWRAVFEGVATTPTAEGEARQAKPAGDRTQDLPPGGNSHEGPANHTEESKP